MKMNIAGLGIDLTDALKTKVEDGLNSLDTFFYPDTVATVTLKLEKNDHIADFNIPVKGTTIHIEERSSDMYKSIDNAIVKIEQQIKKYREKIDDKKHN